MLALSMISWWYSRGWGIFAKKIRGSFSTTSDFFSFDTLFRTLFLPFRQISAGDTGALAVSDKLRESFDKLFSRFMGLIVRTFLILMGVVTLIVQAIFGAVSLILWPVIPILPIVGLVISVVGVGA